MEKGCKTQNGVRIESLVNLTLYVNCAKVKGVLYICKVIAAPKIVKNKIRIILHSLQTVLVLGKKGKNSAQKSKAIGYVEYMQAFH